MKKSSPPSYCHCSYLYERLNRQEEAIAQLVEIIGTTNRRLYDLDQRHHCLTQPNGKAPATLLQPST